MGIISKIETPQDTNLLGGKPVRVTRFKDGEILAYDSSIKQWKAIPIPISQRGNALFVSTTDPSLIEAMEIKDVWLKI